MVLKLKTGEKFIIDHYLDALTIKEIYGDNDYKLTVKCNTIIDIGANIGTFSVLASRLNPKAKVYSYEPIENTYRMLRINVALNDINNVVVNNEAVGGSRGNRRIFGMGASGLSGFNRNDGKPEIIKTVTLDSIFRKYSIRQCDLLKIDCEGAEYEIIENTSPTTMRKIRSIVLEYHDSITNNTHTKLVDILRDAGFIISLKPHPLEDDIGIIYATK